MSGTLTYACLSLVGVFVSSVSQVLLKKSANREHDSAIREYLNPLVISAYLDATAYVWVTLFGVTIFRERLSVQKLLALALVVGGIVIYALGSA